MIKKILSNSKNILLLVILLFYTNIHYASEILIYADNISYDSNENIIAKGKAKILQNNKILFSDLIIYSKKNKEIILPSDFSLKDERNNYYFGTSGIFKSNLEFGNINDVKVLLNDGSRIVGKNIKRDKNIDIISKGVYSPCNSKIKIANFLCPIWQIEGEKMLHDYDNLFLYQKHTKMRFLNLPIFYSPYLVTPSPLRKDRKSGFLSPSINLNFFDTKTSQSTSLPYYFNISEDKELTLIPTINYGGGIDSSQRFVFDYNQLVSGGKLNLQFTTDTTLENNNKDKWIKEGSLITKYDSNINEKYKINFQSAIQTSKNYIQQTNPNDDLSYSSSLKTSLLLTGYNINRFDDNIKINISNYQSNQNDEDNKTIPTILPHIQYYTGKIKYNNFEINNIFETYNIFRDKPTDIHSKSQRKLSSEIFLKKNSIKYGTQIAYNAQLYNQFFNVENKLINDNSISGNYFRFFPIFGIELETPFKFKNNYKKLVYKPNLQLIISPGLSNSNKISNEDSSINSYAIDNNLNLNRFTGNDKLDNSKRVNLSLNVMNENINATILQTYEFTNNSNFHYSQGNEKKLSDFLGNINMNFNSISSTYNFRYNHHDNFVKKQNIDLTYDNKFGNINLSYLDQKSKSDQNIISDKETLNYKINSKKINKYSQFSYFGLYDLKNEINKENGLSYSYFDECFGVNIDFKRNSYTENDLKPQDILTLMFSFKSIGSYKSSNLAVSETDKQDIEWQNLSINNDLFN